MTDDQPLNTGEIRAAVLDLALGDVKVQGVKDTATGALSSVIVTLEQQVVDESAESEIAEQVVDPTKDANESAQGFAAVKVKQALSELLGDGHEFLRQDVVGPRVSGELLRGGITAVVLAIGMMLLYIWFRFEWQFSLGAILALAHDVTLTLGVFAFTQIDFNLAIIAAILTIVGYSMNDTVVVYDRVRENLRKYKKRDLGEVLDLSINETLSRTMMTSVTTLLVLVILYFFGGTVLRGFTFAMIFGVLIGTYSSIFVASPLLLAIGVKRDWNKNEVATTAEA